MNPLVYPLSPSTPPPAPAHPAAAAEHRASGGSWRALARLLPALALATVVGGGRAIAANPLITDVYTADPAALVHDGRVYLYTGHDEAAAGTTTYVMRDWLCYSSADMVNWRAEGSPLSLAAFSWARQDAWAGHVVERDGKFYYYVPMSHRAINGFAIGVAVADQPTGPFVDARGSALITNDMTANGAGITWDDIDPAVFIDDDGQAYLYFGNPELWYVKLNRDMISYSGEIMQEPTKPANYQEGPWFYKHGGHYYMAYASTCCPEGIGYAMSDSPTGPWKYQGHIVKPDPRSTGNHPGIVDYKGGSYVFGFNYKLNFAATDKHHERRSICVERFAYNPDGTIHELPWWEEAPPVPQLGTLDPFRRVEGETICWSEGIRTAGTGSGGLCAYPIRSGAYIKVQGVDFAGGVKALRASVAASAPGGRIELRLDRADGPILGTLVVPNTGDLQVWATASIALGHASGVHDVFLVFSGTSAAQPRLDWWQVE